MQVGTQSESLTLDELIVIAFEHAGVGIVYVGKEVVDIGNSLVHVGPHCINDRAHASVVVLEC